MIGLLIKIMIIPFVVFFQLIRIMFVFFGVIIEIFIFPLQVISSILGNEKGKK